MRRLRTFEALEERRLLWATSYDYEGISYFYDQQSVQRFDLANGEWLSPIALEGGSTSPRAITVHDDAIYVAEYNGRVDRYDLDGGNRVQLLQNKYYIIRAIYVDQVDDDLLLFAHEDGGFSTYNPATGIQQAAASDNSVEYTAFDPVHNRIMGRSRYGRDAKIYYYDSNGVIDQPATIYGREVYESRTWTSPDGALIITDDGWVSSIDAGLRVASLGSEIDALAFYQDQPIVQSGRNLTLMSSLDSNPLPVGSIVLDAAPAKISAYADHVVAFFGGGGSPQIIPIADFQLQGSAVDPVELAYTPTAIVPTNDGKLLLLSDTYQSVFRWDTAAQQYLPTIPLSGAADRLVYLASTNTAFLSYPSGLISKIDLNTATPVEELLTIWHGPLFQLVVADQYLLLQAIKQSSTQYGLSVVDANLQIVATKNSIPLLQNAIWDTATQRMYFAASSKINSLEINADGTTYPALAPGGIGTLRKASPTTYDWPMAVSPDGSTLLTSSGRLFASASLALDSRSLAGSIKGAAWTDQGLDTLHTVGSIVELRNWNAEMLLEEKAPLSPGTAIGLLPVGSDRLVSVGLDPSGVPRFVLLDEQRQVLAPSAGFLVTESEESTSVFENGDPDTLEIVLTQAPASDVVIQFAPIDARLSVSKATLRFTPENWNLPQTVQVFATEDNAIDASPSFLTVKVVRDESDPAFHAFSGRTILAKIEDNDTRELTVAEHGGIRYTFAANHARVTRFDLSTQSWLPTIVLEGAGDNPRGAAVTDMGIYVAYDQSVYRFDFSGDDRTLAYQGVRSISNLFFDGNLLLIAHVDSSQSYLTSFDTLLGQEVATYNRSTFYNTFVTFDRGARRLIGRTTSNNLASIGYRPDGQFVDFAAINTTANGQQFPQGWRRIDSFSRIVSTTTLETLGFLPTGTTSNVYSLYFLESGHILALHWGKLNLYDANLTRVGSLTVDYSLKEMMLDGSNILLRDNYYPDGPWTLTVPLSQLMPANETPPENIAYDPEGVIAMADGTVYINAKLLTQVLRWNSSTQAFESPIQLRGVAEAISYSAAQNALFVAYGNGDITRIDLNGDELLEVPFAAAGNRVVGMTVAGDYLFVSTYSTRMTFSPEGVLVELIPAGGDPVEYLWSDASQSVYYRLVTTSPAVQIKINADGTIPGEPPGGIASVASIGESNFGAPVEVSPDGQQLLFAGGLLVDTAYPQFALQRLANAVTDGAWMDDELFTIRAFDTFSELQRWTGAAHLQTRSLQIPGKPYAIKALPDERLLVISSDGQGVPLLRIFDRDFHEIQRQVGLLLDQSDGSTQVNETGTTDTIGLTLSAPPTGQVTITITSWDTGEATVSPAALVFTSENWDVPQIVTVTGADDTLVDRTQSAILQFTSDSVSVPTRYVTATIVDNEQVSLPVVQFAGIAYFFMTNESRVERFEIASETWLPPIQLEGVAGVPTAALVDESALYVAYGSTLLRYELDGSQPTVLVTTANQIQSLYVDGDLIFLVQTSSPKLESYDKHQGTLLATSSQYLAVTAIDPVNNRLYGVSSGYLRYIDYDEAGNFSGLKSLSSTANRLWVSPDGAKLFASNGSIHVGLDLQGYAAIPGNIADMAFLGNDVPIVLRSNQLATYNNALAQTGTLTFNHVPSRILVNDVHVITLTLDMTSPSGFLIRTIPLALLNPATPQAPLDPHDAPFAPDDVETTSDGTLLLLSKLHNAIFRWLPATQTFGATIPLAGEVDAITYFAPTNSIFVAYESKQLVRIDLDDPQLTEHPVVVLPNRLYGLGVAGEYLVAAPGPNTYRTDGTLVDTSRYEQTGNDATWRARRGEFAWNEFQQRVFYAVGTSMMSTEINANGVSYPTEPPGGVGNTRSGGGSRTTGFVRISPDEKTAILGSGYVMDLSGQYFTTLAGPLAYFKDAAWIGSRPYTLRAENGYSIVEERMTTDYTVIRSWQVNSATPHSLRAIEGGRLLLITVGANLVPVFTVLDAELQTVAAPPATIVGRQIFYNNSKFDHEAPGVDGDDAAIATDKQAYLPGDGLSEFASVSSYAQGINGLMIDLAGPRGLVSVDDFTFHVGTGGDPNGWSAAPAPSSFTVRLGAGVDGSDRIEITWPDGAIRNTWLQVRIRANADTGLAEKFPGVFGTPGYGDVFYFGNKVGDTGEGDTAAFITSAADEAFTRAGVGFNRPITELRDFNRDGVVSAADLILVRTNTAAPILQRLDIPAPEAVATASLAGDWGASEPAGAPSEPDLNQVATALAMLAMEDSAHGSRTSGPTISLDKSGSPSGPASATIDRHCGLPVGPANVDDFFANLTLAAEDDTVRLDELPADSAELLKLRI